MTVRVNVAGGTNAGSRTPPAAPAQPWVHVCRARPTDGGVVLSGYFRNCPACYTARPSR